MIVSKRKEKQKLRQKSLECVRNSERERASPEKASRDRRIMTDCKSYSVKIGTQRRNHKNQCLAEMQSNSKNMSRQEKNEWLF